MFCGCRVGEASNPGPGRRRRRVSSSRAQSCEDGQGLLLMHNQREVHVPQYGVGPEWRSCRSMRDTPVDALSDNEPLIRPNNGRHPRMEPVQPSPGDLSATVPASSGALRGRCHAKCDRRPA